MSRSLAPLLCAWLLCTSVRADDIAEAAPEASAATAESTPSVEPAPGDDLGPQELSLEAAAVPAPPLPPVEKDPLAVPRVDENATAPIPHLPGTQLVLYEQDAETLAAADEPRERYRELLSVEGRLADIHAEKPRIAAPLTLMITGIGLSAGALELLLLNAQNHASAGMQAGAVIAATAGVSFSIGGLVWLTQRLDERRVQDAEIQKLKERRRALLYGMQFGFSFDHQQQPRLSLSGRF